MTNQIHEISSKNSQKVLIMLLGSYYLKMTCSKKLSLSHLFKKTLF